EFKNEDNSLDKLLARYKTETKTISEPNKESTSNSTAKAMQSPTQPVQASQSVPNDDNLGIGATNQEKIEEVADKKNFENSEISFGYPSEYKIEENNGQVTVIKEEAMWRMKIYDNKNKKELTQWFSAIFSGKENADCVWSDPLTLKIGDLATKLAKASTASGKCDGTGYFAMNTDKTKIIRIRLDKADETEANEILASFKFIK
ncbi:MAG TPA: hypothetical protein VK255_00995, partial [Patescibacteria group bacterium]|nr:hypothetical protein [Patescibacteria group bacterium]